MSSIDQQFVEFIVKSLVSKPEAVSIERRIDEKGVLLELTVDPEDLGRVIGKRGATAQSLRTLLRALGTKNDARYNLKIVDNGEPGAGGSSHRDDHSDHGSDGDDQGAHTNTPPPKQDDDDDLGLDDEDHKDSGDRESESDSTTSSVVSKTRKELEELDDLDV